MAGGVAATDAIAKVTDAAKLSTEQLNTALQQRIQAQSQLDQLSQMQFDLENKKSGSETNRVKKTAMLPKRVAMKPRHNGYRTELYKLEIERMKAAAVAETRRD